MDTVPLNFYEKFILKRRELEKKLLQFHNIGKTRLSFLLIPHNNEKIFKIETSIYLIGLVGLMSVFIFLLTVQFFFGLIFLSKTKQELISRGNYQKNSFLYHEALANQLLKEGNELEENLVELNRTTLGKFSKNLLIPEIKFFNLSLSALLFEEELNSNLKLYKEVVEKFSEVDTNLENQKTTFYKSIDYLETRESIVQSMPRGRPLGPGVGFISSTYGKREDPVLGGGEMHNGVDFASSNGTPIYATAPGIIGESAFSENSLGNYVKINHENGFYTIYAHCSETLVSKGDKIKRGQLIAKVGSTGKSTGTHVHYEVHIGMDPPYNPQEFINLD
ncbi:MAG: M23 family metallopeptidase [Leptospiraceae bacterium]|nr:M23 family metallopeptidase [Leptospiraceae bacterium]